MDFAKFSDFQKFVFAVAVLGTVATLGVSDGKSVPARHRHASDCAHEPMLPPLLAVTRDAADPDRLHIETMGNANGMANLAVESAAGVQWDAGASPARAKLERGKKRAYGLRVAKGKKGAPRRIKVSLTIEDEAGRPSMSVQQEMDLDAQPSIVSAAQTLSAANGRAADGVPVIASVPTDAPQPTVAGVAP